jgi:predicted dehydrogenase
MPSRRSFFLGSATAALSSSLAGANDRIRFAVIGAGVRGSHVASVFAANEDCQCAAVCDVYKPTREKVAAQLPGQPEAVVDYRRVLDRKDIDAVLIATPDHWHGPMVMQACEAGKDCYVEKPLTHSIAVGIQMIEAVKKHKRIVQVGLQQRSWDHFQENAKRVQDGMLGTVFQAQCVYRGNYLRPPETPTDPPPDLDWNLFQGPAERRLYTPTRQRLWRSFYDYAGGTLLDWGVHLTHIAQWYMNAKAPLTASGSGQYVRTPCPERDQLPDAVACTWVYDKFVMTYTNSLMALPQFDAQGNYFLGTIGSLHVNRTGYRYWPNPPMRPPRSGEAPPPSAFDSVDRSFPYVGQPADRAHVRNFLDCVKSRSRPAVDIEDGFYATLPTLMGVMAVRYGKTYAWTGRDVKPV